MGDLDPGINVGNKILFVGGPEAGNVRIIPESHGDVVMADNDYVYKIWPFSMKGHKATMYLACAADKHPMDMLLEMWREYAPAAQIRRKTDVLSYNKLGPASP